MELTILLGYPHKLGWKIMSVSWVHTQNEAKI